MVSGGGAKCDRPVSQGLEAVGQDRFPSVLLLTGL